MSTVDSFGSKGVLNVAGTDYEIFRLNSVEAQTAFRSASRYCLKTSCGPKMAPI